jgi:3-hydroxyacyl-CoA dehydrogenase
MWYADTIGPKTVYERIRHFQQKHGDRWAPAPLLQRLADSGKSFAEFDAERAAGS